MDKKEIRRQVGKLRREYALKVVSAAALKDVFEKQGFTVILFNPVHNSEEVTLVVNALGLSAMILQSNGFIYTDQNYRLVFVNEKLTEKEQMYVLAHEEGHYYLGHSGRAVVSGRSVTEEHEASEFAHYLLKTPALTAVKGFVRRHRVSITVCAAVLLLSFIWIYASKEYHDRQLYEGEYYVTENGEKYHRKDCVTIQGHDARRLTKEDVRMHTYSPCNVCQPDQ